MNSLAHSFETPIGGPTKVYSYTRFSTPEQAAGDSQRRQVEAAEKWAERKGLTLDMRLSRSDCGVSAYRGTNTGEDRGLGEFLSACRSGLIEPGSYLLVESLDRISRMTPRRCQRLLDDIVDAGVTIVTLSDGQEYDEARLDNDPTALLIALMVSWRAHEESKTKGRRVAAAWAEKRRRVREGIDRKLTRRAPPWLRWEGEQWEIDQGRAEVVRRVYRMTIEGGGEHRIAKALNREGVPPLGRGRMWHRSAVAKLLRTPTVIGTLTPGHMAFDGAAKRLVLEQPIEDAYPAVIEQADWHTVRAIKDGRSASVRGRGSNAPLSNLFGGLARCCQCGATMTRVNKGNVRKGGRPKLVCTRAKVGAAEHPYRGIDLETLEQAFLGDWQALLADVPAGEAGVSLDDDCAALEGEIAYAEDRLETLVSQNERRPSNALLGSVHAVEAQLSALRVSLGDARERRDIADGGLIHARLGTLAEAVEAGDGREGVNAALRSLFDGVAVDHLSGHLRFAWKQGGESSIVYAMPGVHNGFAAH